MSLPSDTGLYECCNMSSLTTVQSDINRISSCLSALHLTIDNPTKQIHDNNQKAWQICVCPSTPNLLNHPIQRVTSYKYLGLLITSNLAWTPHKFAQNLAKLLDSSFEISITILIPMSSFNRINLLSYHIFLTALLSGTFLNALSTFNCLRRCNASGYTCALKAGMPTIPLF